MDVQGSAEHSQPQPSVMLNGPPIRLINICLFEDAYLFCVALPGVRKDRSNLECEIQRDGMVQLQGIITDGGIVKDSSSVQQLGPSRPFTISFKLPGPVDPRSVSPNLRTDGILEVMVARMRVPSMQAEA